MSACLCYPALAKATMKKTGQTAVVAINVVVVIVVVAAFFFIGYRISPLPITVVYTAVAIST